MKDQILLGMILPEATSTRAQWLGLQSHPAREEIKECWQEMADALIDLWAAIAHGEGPIEESNAFAKAHNLIARDLCLIPEGGDRRAHPRVSLVQEKVGEIMRDFDIAVERLRRWVDGAGRGPK